MRIIDALYALYALYAINARRHRLRWRWACVSGLEHTMSRARGAAALYRPLASLAFEVMP